MRINDTTKRRPVTFADIEQGKAFKVKDKTNYYMRIASSQRGNAINLGTGSFAIIKDWVEVIPLDAEVRVEEC